ncbi:MAG: protein-disulfide reductase DsbD [Granulosicoccus sp.]|nr:protein-disulfide reductase DsbD [Granulosicoccus sp.]
MTFVLLLASALGAATSTAQSLPGFGGDSVELLEPTVAFSPAIDKVTDESLHIRFTIAEGYYLYRKRLDVEAIDENLVIGAIELPRGKIINDEYFGDSEIYRDQVTMKVAYQIADGATADASLATTIKVHSQGCADIGVCYPPQEQNLPIELPSSESSMARSDIIEPVANEIIATGSNGLSSLFGDSTEELLPPDIALVPAVSVNDANRIDVRFSIEPGYYMYRDTFAASFDGDNAQIAAVDISRGKLKDDAYFGEVEVHREQAQLTLNLASASAGEHTLNLEYQGCADIGVCFPPQTTSIPVVLSALSGSTAVSNDTAQVIASKTVTTSDPDINSTSSPARVSANASGELSEQDRLAKSLSDNNLWLIALSFFGLGLLLSFTPCVFPMIPILSSIIVGQGEKITTRTAFILSVIYVLAMAITYTIAGIIVGLSGENIQILFQNPWVLSAFALLFVLLSLSMFGFFELQMPAAIQNRLNAMSNKAEGGTYIGAGIMGLLSALIVGPCVTAPLVGALIFIADTGNAVIGGTALFALGMGMGAPLILIGASCGAWLPRAGAWMDATKAVFGVLLLGMAIWMLSRFIPGAITLALSAALIIVSGIYMGALDNTPEGSSGWRKLFKGLGLVALVYGIILLLGAASGSNDLFQPLKNLTSARSGNSQTVSAENGVGHAGEIEFKRIKSLDDLQTVVATAKQNNQAVMFDFYADWCISCIEMEKFTFSDPAVKQRLENVVLVQADVTKNDAVDKALLKHFKLFGPPAIIFFTPDNGEIRNAQVVGFMKAEAFAQHLDKHLGS